MFRKQSRSVSTRPDHALTSSPKRKFRSKLKRSIPTKPLQQPQPSQFAISKGGLIPTLSQPTKSTSHYPKVQTTTKRRFLSGIFNALRPAPTSAFEMPPIDPSTHPQQSHPRFSTGLDHHTYPQDVTSPRHGQSPPPHLQNHDHHQHQHHQHGEDCQHPHSVPDSNVSNPDSAHTHSSPHSQPLSNSHSRPHQQSRYRKMTQNEHDLAMILCNIKHPETGMDIIQGEFVTQVKETSPGSILIKIKLDKNFRQLKSQIESVVMAQYNISASQASSSLSPHDTSDTHVGNKKWLKSLKVSLADTQDDPQSLYPVQQPPISSTITTGGKKSLANPPGLKTTSVGTSTEQKPKSQQSLTTANQTTGSGARGLSAVKKVILVYSGKGGVGKSSVAVNLAAAMSQLPASPTSPDKKLKIGLFDADIFGPSLPSLIDVVSLSQGIIGADGLDPTPNATSPTIDLVEDYQDDTSAMIRPIRANNIKMMSYGYVTRTKGGHGTGNAGPAPAIMRGGMVGPYLTELLTRTNWGDLDALIIDMPPGTSDVHITITQQVKNASAVIVTTPSKLAFVDVVRGMQLLDQTSIPIVSLVQNMSYFVAPNDPSKTKHYIFGGGPPSPVKPQPNNVQQTYQSKLLTLGSIPTYVEMPIIPTISNDAEEGLPLTMKHVTTLRKIINSIPDNATQIVAKDPQGTAHAHSSLVNSTQSTTQKNSRTFAPESLATLDPILSSLGSSQSTTTTTNNNTNSNNNTTDHNLATTLYNFALLAKQVHHWSSPVPRSTISRPDMNMDFDSSSKMLRIRSGNHHDQHSEGVFDLDAPEPIDLHLEPRLVRQRCVCAACIHEFTGTPLSDPTKIPLDVHPTAIQARGSYAVAVQWSDGHSGSIYTWDMLLGLAANQTQVKS